ncbi:MAG: hypothetical protein ACP5I2_04230 [Fervidicoccaceae archaeon]|jgi:hypothetical protein|nr:MAG: hypothetical protein C0179_03840 [Fervidicoccus sp.]
MSEVKSKKRPIEIIKLSDMEIPINEDLLKILRKYVLTQMTLEELARELGLGSWEKAYEFVKSVPAWLIWTPFTMWEITE